MFLHTTGYVVLGGVDHWPVELEWRCPCDHTLLHITMNAIVPIRCKHI